MQRSSGSGTDPKAVLHMMNVNVLVLARMGHGQDLEVILHHLTSLSRDGEEVPSGSHAGGLGRYCQALGAAWLHVNCSTPFYTPLLILVLLLFIFLFNCCFQCIVLVSTHDLYLLCL